MSQLNLQNEVFACWLEVIRFFLQVVIGLKYTSGSRISYLKCLP